MPLHSPERRDFLRRVVVGAIAISLTTGTAGLLLWRHIHREEGDGGYNNQISQKIDEYYGVLSRELQISWEKTNARLQEVFDALKSGLRQGGTRFSRERITRRGIAGLVFEMAKDRMDRGTRTDAWFAENLAPFLQPALHRFNRELRVVEQDFEEELAASFDRFNEQTATLLSATLPEEKYRVDAEKIKANTAAAFVRRGIKAGAGSGLGIGVMAGGVAVWIQGQLARILYQRIQSRLVRLFTPLARRLAGRLGASALTMKVPPVALIIATIGGVWTGYDIHALRRRAQNDFRRALEESLEEMEKEFRKKVVLPFLRQMVHFQENEQQIREEIVEGITTPRPRRS